MIDRDGIFVSEPLWTPLPADIESANITAFMRVAEERWDLKLSGYQALHAWSVERPEQFWHSVWDFTDIVAETRGSVVVDSPDDVLNTRFFPEARLCFAENLLRRRDGTPAVIFWSEDGQRRKVTFGELYDLVSRISQGLRGLGVAEGDRVAAVLPALPEALACMLAVNSIGAVWSSCSPDFGVQGVVDRIGQMEPKVLIGADHYPYKGQRYDTLGRIREICDALPTLENVILVPYRSGEEPEIPMANARSLNDFIEPYTAGEISFSRLPFDHPAFVLYTSGTTGAPKPILHAAGRSLLKLFVEQWLHFDVKPGDRFYYFTTTGWNMWYTLITALGPGATILMYDGSPFHPGQDIIFDLADAEKMTVFGTSPRYLDTIRKAGLRPRKTHDLSSVKSVISTGAPLSQDVFDYVYNHVKKDIRLSSISGGTELMATLASSNPIGPVWRGELQAPTLGMNTDVYGDDGKFVSGEKGELVCKPPIISRPLRFLNDPGDERYHETYFSRFPNVWYHGDFAKWTDHRGLIIYGRSDATLNPGGIRIGTAEIYRPLEEMDEVEDSLVTGQDWKGDTRVILFVKLRDGLTLNAGIKKRINQKIRTYASPRHVPEKIFQVVDIPYTRNGKKVELAVKNIIHNRPVDNLGSVVNPEALKQFENLKNLWN